MNHTSSGELMLLNEREAVGAYFASGFIDQWVYCRDLFQVSACYGFM